MQFCTAVNCMDVRAQLPVIKYLQDRFGAEYVDSITEAGPIRILAEEPEGAAVQSILKRIQISVEKHSSVGIAVAGHVDCAGNPVPDDVQTAHLKKAVAFLQQKYQELEIIGLWVDDSWEVHEVE